MRAPHGGDDVQQGVVCSCNPYNVGCMMHVVGCDGDCVVDDEVAICKCDV